MAGKKNKRIMRRRRQGDAIQKWIAWLRKTYGVFDTGDSGVVELLYSYMSGPIPGRIPRPMPGHPITGGELTIVQQASSFNTATNIGSMAIHQNAATPLFGAVGFSLVDLPQSGTWTSAFDQYRIDYVHFRVRSRNTALNVANLSGTTEAVPQLTFVVDYDDATALASIAALQNYDNSHEFEANDSFDIVLRPCCTPAIFSGGAFTGYGTKRGQWLDCANNAIPHYGVKFGVSGLDVTTTSSWYWDVQAYYVISFKGVR
jgi:hypothetical protein